ncbi:hypothetical protein [Galbitalea soli]|uniref:Uncharacterized protein n=1 Tax=Galbitalea soli TaxID=1268042 RepID=A0A7C9TQ83_9MICO|nr:hypothetical protein [Galbitalea soli]NEM90761.1 hypothetical protein [Galbitalea soli]NYJ31479.1 hypothetical protein [Galbitalea soli]
MALYPAVTHATITWYEPGESWNLEIWAGDDDTALALWPLAPFDDLNDEDYARVSELLSAVEIDDDGREGWAIDEERVWRSSLRSRVSAEEAGQKRLLVIEEPVAIAPDSAPTAAVAADGA